MPMTGKDLIVYILKNDLEDEFVFRDGKFVGFLNVKEAAVKFGTGEATIWAYCAMDMLDGYMIGEDLYIPATAVLKHQERKE